MKKLLLLLTMVLSIIGCGKKDEKINIGITQIVEHSALDEVVQGFKQALKDKGYDDTKVSIELQNAQGDFGVAQTIANSFVQSKKNLVLAVSTPSAQAMYNVTKDIPIIISAVTDPVSAGLVGENITGVSDMAPVAKQVELIKTLLPNAKNIGVVYNTSEENSLVLIDILKKESSKYGYTIKEKGVNNINEIGQALDVLLKEVDVLYTPTDNLIVSATPLVLEKSKENCIPVIGCIEDQIKQGALATETISYKNCGYQAGEIAIKILNGEKPNNIPVQMPENTVLMINESTMKNLNISLPDSLKERAIIL